jgi:hypothetical protein
VNRDHDNQESALQMQERVSMEKLEKTNAYRNFSLIEFNV